ncbi:MAG: heavy-metal-associated domain-containing protein [Gemmatimonadaceae bacterium]|nr:heavy-metal-associated domain-containing protein [Gemmatimonadaceae bacterium]MCW5826419.1 heavy-metal-associated domain-containing protein [Gemmatimonadaceae bacterium]
MTTATLTITGMSCSSCLRHVQQALNAVDGARLDELRIGRATVTYDETQVSAEAIAEAVRGAGYGVDAVM